MYVRESHMLHYSIDAMAPISTDRELFILPSSVGPEIIMGQIKRSHFASGCSLIMDAPKQDALLTGNPTLALYVVLPVFFVLYGGSCFAYCVYNIYMSCQSSMRMRTKRLGVRHMITIFQPSPKRFQDFRVGSSDPRPSSPPPPFEEIVVDTMPGDEAHATENDTRETIEMGVVKCPSESVEVVSEVDIVDDSENVGNEGKVEDVETANEITETQLSS